MQTLRQPERRAATARITGTSDDARLQTRSVAARALQRKTSHGKIEAHCACPLTIEGIAPGRYRLLQAKEAQTILAMKPVAKKFSSKQEPTN